ncbi:APO protein 1, chloroplastic [Selaginella moellendorffii]|uniref:APO protein 1, chloroplastic n=1 Tax=Selaginella moellendorffii TaxID=88036 RepID=UPI000D1C4500|nr:APO protein 1, chloroplastic [Selaginella moellendorffii]|eukprot:XP_024528590.1 APO protein 1, chloroplastic [Selaginella moellendorffii]
MLWRAQGLRIDRKNSSFWLRLCRDFHPQGREATREFPQNRELPPLVPPKKKPYYKPLPLVIWEHRRDKRLGVRRLWKAPLNGMLVEDLIPLAHDVLKEYAVLEEGVKRLMKSVTVKACTCCMEIYVGKVGHKLPTCRGTSNRAIYGQHRWIRGYVEDVIIPLEAYHVYNKIGRSIKHSQRYTVPRVGAIHELCMQAGVDDPRYPMIRWARRSGRQVGDGQAQIPLTRFRNKIIPGYSSSSDTSDDDDDESGSPVVESKTEADEAREEPGAIQENKVPQIEELTGIQENEAPQIKELTGIQESEAPPIEDSGGCQAPGEKLEEMGPDEVPNEEEEDSRNRPRKFELRLAEEELGDLEVEAGESRVDAEKRELKAVADRTLVAFDSVRRGLQALLYKYKVWACGYCSEVHIGVKPHKVLLCGGLGRAYRGGGHAWQEAALSDVFPPNFVWHVPANHHPRLSKELIRYYGQTPAIVEMCVQAGAEAPPRWKAYMRMDVAIPLEEEMLWTA